MRAVLTARVEGAKNLSSPFTELIVGARVHPFFSAFSKLETLLERVLGKVIGASSLKMVQWRLAGVFSLANGKTSEFADPSSDYGEVSRGRGPRRLCGAPGASSECSHFSACAEWYRHPRPAQSQRTAGHLRVARATANTDGTALLARRRSHFEAWQAGGPAAVSRRAAGRLVSRGLSARTGAQRR